MIEYEPMSERRRVPFERMEEILKKWSQLSREMWLVTQLKKKAASQVFDGATTQDDRKARVREVISKFNLSAIPCGQRNGKRATFSEVFELIFGEPL